MPSDAEVVGRDVVATDDRRVRRIDRAAGQKQNGSRAAAERRAPVDGGRFDARHGLDAREQPVHRGRARRHRIPRTRRPHPERQARRRTRSRVRRPWRRAKFSISSPDAVSRRHAIATSVTTRIESASAAAAAAAIVLLERGHQLRTRRRQRRHEREQQRRTQRDGEGEHQHDGIERRRAEAANGGVVVAARSRSPQAPSARRRRRPTRPASCRITPAALRHHQSLGEQSAAPVGAGPNRWPAEPRSRGAERARARGAGWPR